MLKEFLAQKPLYYNEIDYTRMPRVYEAIKSYLDTPKIIHIIGTNGKGTTGRFLATALVSLGLKGGHYTSPHILEFNERIWLNGQNASDEILNLAHEKLQTILATSDSDALSYFEYTTLLCMIVYKGCDFVVLEAGLGGEYDATAVFPNLLTLVTPIDYDHEAFLGNSIQEIATTKLNAMQKSVILANQKHQEVEGIAKKIALQKGVEVYNIDTLLRKEDTNKIEIISKNLSLARYLQENLKLSICVLNFLGLSYSVDDFNNSKLFGRLTKISENITIDVGHNPLAASSLVNSLYPQKYILIYNTYKDKNYQEILEILKPIIRHVEIIEVLGERVEKSELLQKSLTELKIEYSSFKEIHQQYNYLVFGSFSVVEAFLNWKNNG
ncbi:MAG: bifunctional folylpolyglutamate synthase/dihydrofolate synthase [Campylobacterales bacterium]|nr:bifunctional folylpolyglutamate synthase/dihydrofolate synthase [Campylobacterales bacterium]